MGLAQFGVRFPLEPAPGVCTHDLATLSALVAPAAELEKVEHPWRVEVGPGMWWKGNLGTRSRPAPIGSPRIPAPWHHLMWWVRSHTSQVRPTISST